MQIAVTGGTGRIGGRVVQLLAETGQHDVVALSRRAGGRASLVAREDAARCLAALALGEPTNRHHDVTGPESLSVGEIAAAAGHRYADTTPAEFAGTLVRLGEEPWWIYAYSTMFAAIREQRWAATSDAVTAFTGHPPVPLSHVLTHR